jgi:hypothetical protein
MYPGDVEDITLSEYRQLEMQLHLELMNTCRKFISKIGIVSIMGILDIVKQEAMELEKAMRDSDKREEYDLDNNRRSEIDSFSR